MLSGNLAEETKYNLVFDAAISKWENVQIYLNPILRCTLMLKFGHKNINFSTNLSF